MGAGAMTGRGFGSCVNAGNPLKNDGFGLGLGMACRHGFGHAYRRFSAVGEMTTDKHREILQSQKNALENRLADIDRQLEIL